MNVHKNVISHKSNTNPTYTIYHATHVHVCIGCFVTIDISSSGTISILLEGGLYDS